MLRFPIGLKLIIAAVLLVTALTAGFVAVAIDTLERVYEEQAEQLQAARVADMERRSVGVAERLGQTASEALAVTETGRLHRVLANVAEGDAEIEYAVIADEAGRVLVRSDMGVRASLDRGEELLDINPTGPVIGEVQISGRRVRLVTHPIRAGRQGEPMGYVQLAWRLQPLHTELARIESDKAGDIRRATTLALALGGVAVLLGILGGILGGLGLSRPIRRLAQTARELADGDLSARARVTTRDEIGDLAGTMNHMAGQIGDLMVETRKSAELAHELSVARNIQQALLPARGLVRQPGLNLCGLVEPADECGGDWWAYLKLTRQRTLVLVGDVTGHGISSAMLTATARSCLDTVRQLTKGDFRVGHLLKIMDQLIRESIGDDFHMTCFASILDPIEGTMTYANAGHNHPYLLRHQSNGWRLGRLSARGNRLGDADGHAFVEHTVATSARDLLFWYTDGLIEVEDAEGRPFGDRRLRRVLHDSAGQTPDKVLANVMGAFEDHIGAAELTDDVTVVVGRVVA